MLILPIRFSQLDSRWCDHLLGQNTDPQYTIKNYGCLLCCLAMVLKYYAVDTDPDRLNESLKTGSGFEINSGIYIWGSLAKLFPGVTDLITKTPNALTDDQVNEIKTAIDAGKPVVLWIDYNPKTVENNMHFVVAVAYNPNDENDITIADPLGGTLHSLKDYLGWFKPSARNTIEAYCIIDGPVPAAGTDETIAVNAKVFPQLVHGSDQWDKTVNKYAVGGDPKQLNFEDLDKVVGGIKSRATDMQNQLTAQKGDLAGAQQSVVSMRDQLAYEEKERQEDRDLYLKQIQALKASGLNLEGISQSYEGRIKGLQDTIKGLQQDKHDLSTANARLQATINPVSFIEKYFPTFLGWVAKFRGIKK